MGMNWKEWLVTESTTLQEAMEVLVAVGAKVVFVVDKDRRLKGTVSDGDLRRAQLASTKMDRSVVEIMNSSPISVTPDYSEKYVKSLFSKNKITEIPVLSDGRIVDILTVHEMLEGFTYDNPVFLMAGGYGSRLRPLTADCPKPLLEIGGKPMLETTVRRFLDCGFSKFYISTHYLPDLIRDHFGDGSRFGASIEYIHEEKPLGTAGALGLLPKDEITEPLIMINGDILTKLDFGKMMHFHREHEGIATMAVRQYDFEVPYGVVKSSNGYVKSITEKPIQSFVVNAGIYIFEPEVLNRVDQSRFLDMPNLIDNLMEEGDKVALYLVNEYWLDIGRLEDFERAKGDYNQVF